MINLPMPRERYQEILDSLLDPTLKVKLESNPTTLGPQYISDKIVEILTVKSRINDLTEEVERAYIKAQILVNDLNTELELRTVMELNSLQDGEFLGLDSSMRKALIRQKVELSYIADIRANLAEDEIMDPDPLLFTNSLKFAQAAEIELHGLMSMLKRRSDELGKQDSGVRLQQKTIDVEMRIYKSKNSQDMNHSPKQQFNGLLPHDPVDPDGGEEDESLNNSDVLQNSQGSGLE